MSRLDRFYDHSVNTKVEEIAFDAQKGEFEEVKHEANTLVKESKLPQLQKLVG